MAFREIKPKMRVEIDIKMWGKVITLGTQINCTTLLGGKAVS